MTHARYPAHHQREAWDDRAPCHYTGELSATMEEAAGLGAAVGMKEARVLVVVLVLGGEVTAEVHGLLRHSLIALSRVSRHCISCSHSPSHSGAPLPLLEMQALN